MRSFPRFRSPTLALVAATLASAPFSAALAADAAPAVEAVPAPVVSDDGAQVMVVTAERRDTELARSTSVTEVITADDAADAGHPFNTFELFRSLPGVDVVNGNGGVDGSTTSIRLRGGRAQDTRYLLDGIPLNDTTSDGAINASIMPSSGLERIEVVKGSQSGLYGSNAVSGVINMITRRPTADHEVEGLVEAGSFGTVRGAAGASGMLSDTVGYALDVDGLSSKGFSVTTQSDAEGRPNGNEADSLRRGGARGRLEWTPDSRLTVYGSALHQATNQDYDGFNPLTYSVLPNDDRSSLQTRLSRGATGAQWNLSKQVEIAVDAADTLQRRTYDEATSSSPFDLHEQYASGRVTSKAGAGLAFTVGGDGTWDQGESDSFEASDRTVGAYLQATHSTSHSEVSGSMRHDDNASAGGATTWHAGAAAFDAARIVKPHATIGTGFVAPTLSQRYSSFPSYLTYGNPDLAPEHSLSRDAGITLTPMPKIGASLDVTAWRTDYRDKIEYDTDPVTFVTTTKNITNGRTQGVEASFQFDDRQIPFKARVSTTWQQFEDDKNKLQRLLPQQKAHCEAGWRFTRVWLGAQVDAIGKRWNLNGSDRDLPGYALLGATASWDIGTMWTVYARGENLTNTHYQVNPPNYTTAPIAGYVGVIARL
jgi:vitamin B12 transporter